MVSEFSPAGIISAGKLPTSTILLEVILGDPPDDFVEARQHDQIRVLAVSKLNTIADRISTALTDDKISEAEFRLILSELDKYDQMKAEIRGRQKQGGGRFENEKKQLMNLMRDEAMLTARTKLLEELQAGNSGTSRS